MLLNQTSEYALRAMALLAAAYDGDERVPARDLAQRARIPEHYLSKIMRRMVVAGLVDSLRGHGGGFRLAREPMRIRFIDVLEAVEGAPDEFRCAFGLGQCNPKNPCRLHPAWSRLSRIFDHWARSTTLAQMDPEDPFLAAAGLQP